MLSVAVTSFAMILLGGCASTPPERADATMESMGAAVSRLDRGSAQVDSTLVALDAVVGAKTGDLRPSYKKFADEVTKVESAADAAGKAADRMRQRTQEHFDIWANEAQAINDPTLKEANIERRNAARKSFAKVTGSYEQTKRDYSVFISGLRDLRTFLGANLTAQGVDAAEAIMKKVRNDGGKLKGSIATVRSDVELVRSELVSPRNK
jgi:hypothetical protein